MRKTWVIKNSDGYPKLEVEAESFVKAVEKVKDKLQDADLSGEDLSFANLRGSDLEGADLSETKGLPKKDQGRSSSSIS